MNTQKLKYFVAAAQSLNFTKTAEQFYISQTAITNQIKSLEDELGAQLFDRSNKKLKLTAAGNYFLIEAIGIIENEENAVRRTKILSNKTNALLRVGLFPGCEYSCIPRVIHHFHEYHPEAIMLFKSNNNWRLMTEVTNGELDLAFSLQVDSYPCGDLMRMAVEESSVGILFPRSHSFADRTFVTLEELKNERFIWWDHPGKNEEEDIDMDLGFHPDRRVVADNLSCLYAMLSADMGICILADIHGKPIAAALNMSFVPLAEIPFRNNVVAIWDEKNGNTALRSFIAFLKEYKKVVAAAHAV